MKSNNTVQINGRTYDARSGELISDAKTSPPHHKPAVKQVDGISHAHTPTHHNGHHGPVKKTIAVMDPDSPKATKPVHSTLPAHHIAPSAHSRPKRSALLRRSGVTMPSHAALVVASEEIPVPENPTPTIKAKFDDKRLQRASTISRSPVISRFSAYTPTETPKPVEAKVETPRPATEVHKTDLSEHLRRTHLASDVTAKTRMQNTKERLIENRLASAHHAKTQHHTRPAHRQPRHSGKKFGVASTVLVVLLLAGYVTYLNVPSISMKLAASRAGFAATMPGQTPSGYSLKGPIAYSPGQVTINFSSNTDDRHFSVTQQPSTWDSTALLENYVSPKTSNYMTYQDRGLTVYVFDGSNAAWVNAGKLYKVEGRGSSLSSDQILSIATSM